MELELPPAAIIQASPTLQDAQFSSCAHAGPCAGCSARSFDLGSDTTRSLGIPPQLMPSPIDMSLEYISVVFYYSTRHLNLHRIWFGVYQLNPNVNNSDLEIAPTSRRRCWTETIQRMSRVWTLIIMVSSLVMTLSIVFLQIDNILGNIYPRTFAILTFVLASASLVASCIFIASASNLDSVGKFRRWEIASRNPNTLYAVDIWACLALPFTSLLWSTCFCLMALFSLIWVEQGTPNTQIHTSKIDLAFSSALMSIVVLCLVFQFYRVREFLAK